MDTFDKMMKDVALKSEKEKAALLADLKSKCPCPGCPSYNNCAKTAQEAAFCILGNSFMCISYDKGCHCPGCPLHGQYGMKYKSYCTRGSEMAQRYANTIWGSSLK